MAGQMEARGEFAFEKQVRVLELVGGSKNGSKNG